MLHHVAEPGRVLAEVARALAPGGRLLIVDMNPHDRQEYRHEMGHVWLGFDRRQLAKWTDAAGLGDHGWSRSRRTRRPRTRPCSPLPQERTIPETLQRS